jgi:chromosome partitioning protein
MQRIALVNMKGGVAKTTLAVNLADALSRRHGRSVLVVDTDPQFNATQCLVSGPKYVEQIGAGAATIVDIFDDSARPIVNPVRGHATKEPAAYADISVWTIREKVVDRQGALDLVAGSLDLHRLDMAPGQGREFRLQRFLNAVEEKNKYDYAIIDTPPTPSAWMTAALLASNYYIIPVRPEPLSRTGVDLLKGVVDRTVANYGCDLRCLGVVLTVAQESERVFQDAVNFFDTNEVWRGKRFAKALPRRTEIARAQGEQRLILDLSDEAAKSALAVITNEFLERVQNE